MTTSDSSVTVQAYVYYPHGPYIRGAGYDGTYHGEGWEDILAAAQREDGCTITLDPARLEVERARRAAEHARKAHESAIREREAAQSAAASLGYAEFMADERKG